jgi:hypothetical protein
MAINIQLLWSEEPTTENPGQSAKYEEPKTKDFYPNPLIFFT